MKGFIGPCLGGESRTLSTILDIVEYDMNSPIGSRREHTHQQSAPTESVATTRLLPAKIGALLFGCALFSYFWPLGCAYHEQVLSGEQVRAKAFKIATQG